VRKWRYSGEAGASTAVSKLDSRSEVEYGRVRVIPTDEVGASRAVDARAGRGSASVVNVGRVGDGARAAGCPSVPTGVTRTRITVTSSTLARVGRRIA